MQEVVNIVAKAEIAHHEQFLLLSQYFQKSSAKDREVRKCLYLGKG